MDDEEENDDYSPMDDPRLADIKEPDELPGMDKDLPYYVEPSDKPYEVPVTQGMLDFTMDLLRTGRPVEKGIPPEEMVTRTFLMPPMEDGTRARAKIVERISIKTEEEARNHPDMIKFKCLVNDEYEEVVAYNDIVDYIEADETQSGIWTYEELLAHQGPLLKMMAKEYLTKL